MISVDLHDIQETQVQVFEKPRDIDNFFSISLLDDRKSRINLYFQSAEELRDFVDNLSKKAQDAIQDQPKPATTY